MGNRIKEIGTAFRLPLWRKVLLTGQPLVKMGGEEGNVCKTVVKRDARRESRKEQTDGFPLGTYIVTVLAQPIARGIYKTHSLMVGKTRFRKTSDIHPSLTGFSKAHGEATIFFKKWLFYFLFVYSVKDNCRHIIHG